MPRFALSLAVTVLFFLAACGDVGEAPVAETADVAASPAEPDAFTGTALALDTTASTIAWTAAKVTRSHDGGFRQFEGALYLDGEQLSGAEVVIDAGSIYSDDERLTNHLRSADFFDVETIPEVRFRATTFEPLTAPDTTSADATHRVTGTLTMHGQTNRITFPARVAVTPDAVTADADFIIDRQAWGLTYPGQTDDLIRDEVRLRLHAVATRTAPVSAAP